MRRDDDLGPQDREPTPEGRVPPPPPPSSGLTPRRVVIALLVVLLIVFAIANFERVEVNFLLFQTRARVITVVAVAAGLGFVIGWFVGRPGREQRKRLRRLDRD